MKKVNLVMVSMLLLLPVNSNAVKKKALGPSYSDIGGIGLLQMPTGRMAEEGTLGVSANRTRPYSRYAASFQPFPWMEATIRYTSVSGADYGRHISDRSYLDKAIDVKFRILEESHYVPEVSVGLRDLAGTGLFSGEYIAASKRFGPLDFTLGLGWGYLGHRAHASNPFGFLSDSFKTRKDVGSSGEFNTINYFRGPIAFFGGVEYQTPLHRLRLKLEYDSNDYIDEFVNLNSKPAKSPLNYGLVYRLSKNTDLNLGYERGDTLFFGLTWSKNLKKLKSTNKVGLKHEPVINPEFLPTNYPDNWQKLANKLKSIGMNVERIYLNDKEISIYAEFNKSYHHAELLGLASRILTNRLPANIVVFNFIERKIGLSINEISIRRDLFTYATAGLIPKSNLEYSIDQSETYIKHDTLVYKAPRSRFTYSLVPKLRSTYGGPDAVVLYQLYAKLSANFRFNPNFELSGSFGFALTDNYDRFVYDGPPGTGDALPRVRTLIRDFVKGSDAWIENLQFTYTRRLGENWYGMAYAGLLEYMYGGAGVEFLYRPHGSNFALGLDLNYVKQRDFDRRFKFRDYKVATGHLSAYYHHKPSKVIFKTSYGRYLAKDVGVTLDISRRFRNGVTAGVYASKTDVSSEDFGEGSFDKGIYLSIPFDYMSNVRKANLFNFNWHPLLRDGGAKLKRKYSLYNVTRSRDLDVLFSGIDTLTGPVADYYKK